MIALILVPFIIQALVIGFDEYYFHVKRGLPLWERIGHPIDTLSLLACICFALVVPYSPYALKWYIALCVLSCLMITKDEWVHKHHCEASEHWLHALLFINHPIVLTSIGIIWWVLTGSTAPVWMQEWLDQPQALHSMLVIQTSAIACFFLYQVIYWNFIWKRNKNRATINNAFYDELDTMWHESKDHPIALLRAENLLRNPWIQDILTRTFPHPAKVLDVGCGGGYLTNFLATKGHFVSGVDLSTQSLEIAKKGDETKSVEYKWSSAYTLPYSDQSFDAVCAMDLLEHVEKPAQVIAETSRVLKKGGFFFFHTFNRNLLSYFMVIKGVDWCFSNAPKNMHVYPLFIKPEELKEICKGHGLQVEEIKGVRPDFSTKAFWKMVLTCQVDPTFRFVFTSSLKTGYSGYARKV